MSLDEEIRLARDNAARCGLIATIVAKECSASRELSLAITKLDEARLWLTELAVRLEEKRLRSTSSP